MICYVALDGVSWGHGGYVGCSMQIVGLYLGVAGVAVVLCVLQLSVLQPCSW